MNRLIRRFASTLVIAEHSKGRLSSSTLSSLAAAKLIGGPINVLVAGNSELDSVSQELSKYPISHIFQVQQEKLSNGIAEYYCPLMQQLQTKHNFTHFLFNHNSFGKNMVGRWAASLDVAPVCDVIKIDSESVYWRPIYAGNALCKVESTDKVKLLSIRSTAFAPIAPAEEAQKAQIVNVDFNCADQSVEFVGEESVKSDRPELAGAKIVVSGGRGLKSKENFQIIYDLADKMGAAVGASRAAVDAGYAPNDMQVGQTGKVVAPSLYMAVGISGAIQHLAGMKDSKTIVAINKDADAPIFQVADYGLVADLFKAVPELIEKISK